MYQHLRINMSGDVVIDETEAIIAAQIGNIETLNSMRISTELGRRLIRFAIINDRCDVVQVLLHHIQDGLNVDYRSIMMLSMYHSSLPVVSLLITAKCNIGAKNNMYHAIETGQPIEFINGLIRMKADISSCSYYHAPIVGACKNPNIKDAVVLRLLGAKVSLQIKNDDGYEDDSTHSVLCSRIVENCNHNVLRVLLTSKCDLEHDYNNGILGGIVSHVTDLVDTNIKKFSTFINDYLSRLYDMINLLLATQYDASHVHRSVRYIIIILNNWKIDEIACQSICPIILHKPTTSLDNRIIDCIKQRHNHYMKQGYSVWNNRYMDSIARQKYGYETKIENMLRRLINSKVDITSSDNQLRKFEEFSYDTDSISDTVKSAIDMRVRLCELESIYKSDTSPEKRMR